MKTAEPKNVAVANITKANQPFFGKGEQSFFSGEAVQEHSSFFGPQKSSYDLSNGNAIQTKLTIGQPGDKYEQEADSMADKVEQHLGENKPEVTNKNGNTIQTKPVAAVTTLTPFVQTKCAACEQEENMIQRQEQPEPPETKPVSPDNTQPAAPIPLGRKPRAAKCSQDQRFPEFGCLGQQLKLDIDENLFNNAHQFNRVATLFPGDSQLMLDTFLRYGIGKNLLETSFGFAGVNKKWSSILSYGTGAALKTYELIQNGKLKLDVQLPLGKGVNLNIKFDYTAKPENRGEEKGINTVIGVSGSF